MKKHSVLKILTALIIFTVTAAASVPAFAAGASISCPGSVNEGDTFNVSVTFSGENIAAVSGSMSYDASKLQFVSGGSGVHSPGAGSVNLVASQGGGMNSMSFSMTFKAIASGSAGISAGASETLSYDEVSLGGASASKSVTVNASGVVDPKPSPPAKTDAPPATKNPEPSKTKTASPSKEKPSKSNDAATKTPSPTPSPTPEPSPVYVNETPMLVSEKLPKAAVIPENFEKDTVKIDGKDVECAVYANVNINITLVYLTNHGDKTADSGFYMYDGGQYEKFIEMNTDTRQYVFLKTDNPPEGFTPAELKISEDTTVPAWKFDGEDNGFFLVYVLDPEDSEPEFCMYDSERGTMQRYVERIIPSEVVIEAPPTEVVKEVMVTVTPEPTPLPALTDRILNDSEILIVVLALGGLSVILIIILIIIAAKNKSGRGDGGSGGNGGWEDDHIDEDDSEEYRPAPVKKRHKPAH